MRVWAHSGRELAVMHGHEGEVRCVAFAPDGRRLASVGVDRIVRVWDPEAGRELAAFRGHKNTLWSVAFSPDGHRIASSGDDGTLRVWDGRPWGPERLTRRDALSLVRFLTDRAVSEAGLRNQIAADPTISADVRALALALSRGFWEARVRAMRKI